MSRQNVYEDEAFFASYQQLRDSESGLNAAVEQPALRALLPDVTGRTLTQGPAATYVTSAPGDFAQRW